MADAQIEVAPLALPRVFVGRSVMTSEKDMFSDAPVLARRLAEVKEDVPCRVMPVVTAVICDEPGEDGRFRYFTGDEVEPGEEPVRRALAAAEGLEAVRIPAGALAVVVPVPVGTQATLPLRIAAARKRFYEDWLPTSGYRPSCELGFRDVELYHYRRRRFRRATKMVLELMFLVEPTPQH